MKALLILIIGLFFAGNLIGQEKNPWKYEKKENPWGEASKPQEEESKTVEIASTTKIDSTTQKDTVIEKSASTGKITYTNRARIKEVKKETSNQYRSAKDFGVGLAMGLVFNVYGIGADLVYALPDSKREKETIDKIVNDNAFDDVPEAEIKKAAKSEVKGKKLLSSMLGTLVGAVAQFGIIALIVY